MSSASILESNLKLIFPICEQVSLKELDAALQEDDTDALHHTIKLYEGRPSDPYQGQLLLNMAVLCCATRCIDMLISAGHNPNQLDRKNKSSLDVATDRDDFTASAQLAPHCQESNTHPRYENGQQTCCTYLLWPQTLWKKPISDEWMLELHKRGIKSPPWSGNPTDLRLISRLCGASIALVFEFLMATPERCSFSMWSGERLGCDEVNQFWPMPSKQWWSRYPDATVEQHLLECNGYPHCLHDLLNAMLDSELGEKNLSKALCLRRLTGVWCMHRFQSMGESKDNCGPPALKDLTRAAIRRILTYNTSAEKITTPQSMRNENYACCVNRLPIPVVLQRFLTYQDVSPDPDWEEHIQRRGLWQNVSDEQWDNG